MGDKKFQLQESINLFAETLVSLGLQDVVISPGSRNAPLILAFARIRNLHIHSVIDERSAGYTALGIAMKTGRTVAIVCTSGTAAVNFYPSIAEGYYGRIPILVITADRPGKLVDQWVGQTIRQDGLFSNHIRASYHTPEDYLDTEMFVGIATEAYRATTSTISGPVHVNVPLAEPLYDASQEQTARVDVSVQKVIPVVRETHTSGTTPARHARVLVVIGAKESYDYSRGVLDSLPDSTEYVVLPDLISGLAPHSLLQNWDGFLHSQWSHMEHLQPDLVISYGTFCLSKGLSQFLTKFKPQRHIHISEFDETGDPFQTSPQWLKGDHMLFQELLKDISSGDSYFNDWVTAIERWRNAFLDLDWDEFNEFTATRYVLDHMQEGSVLHFSNSMPVRYASFLSANSRFPIYSNRGTSGIDGCTSTAIGYALKTNEPVVLFTGDLAFNYDINALWRKELPSNFRIIVLNNSGGGIFNLIDGPSRLPDLSELQQTPVMVPTEMLSKAYGLMYFRAANFDELRTQFKNWDQAAGPVVLEIVTNKQANKSFYTKFTGKNI